MVIVGGMLRLLLLGSHRPRGRALLSVLGIALGVALGYGVDLVNLAAVDELAAAGAGLAGRGARARRGSARPRRRGGPGGERRARRIFGVALSGHRQTPRHRLGEPRAG